MVTAALPRRPEPRPIDSSLAQGTDGRLATLFRLVRYTGVSVVSTTTSLSVLFTLVGIVGLPAAWSNVVATAVGTVPSFELNRRWVWHRQGRRSLLGQVVPFAALSFTGLLVSTVAVGLVSQRTQGWSHWGHTLAVESANLAAYGSLWVVQYVVLDRLLFRTGHSPSAEPAFTGRRQTIADPVGPGETLLGSGRVTETQRLLVHESDGVLRRAGSAR